MNREQKKEFVDDMKAVFSDAGTVVVAHYSGLNVADLTDLRVRISQAGAGFKVTKNRLARRAAEGTPVETVISLFSGPTAVAWSDDPLAVPKTLSAFSKENSNLVILGGVQDGKPLDVKAVTALAELPSLEELRGRLAALMKESARRVAGVLQAPAGKLARVLQAKAGEAS